MFTATLEELGGQLAALQPTVDSGSKSGSWTSSKAKATPESELLQRLLDTAPSDSLRAYASGSLPPARLQRSLPQQLDDNLRLLSILAAEMRGLLQRLEQLTDAAADDVKGAPSGRGDGISSSTADQALLLAAVLDGAARETQLIVS